MLANNEADFLKYTSRATHITPKTSGKIMLLFMKLNQFKRLTNQFMLDLLFLN